MKVICYGDSNTFGYDPRSRAGESYPAEDRWVDILAAVTGWNVINQGVNGREVPTETVVFPEDTELLAVMLGTNDLLQLSFPEDAAERMEGFLAGVNLPKENILLIAPPAMVPGEWVQDEDLIRDSRTLAALYEALAHRLGIRFADAAKWDIPLCYDGVHFTPEGSRRFANQLLEHLGWPMAQCASVDFMRRSDEYTIANFTPSLELMFRAAEGVYRAQGKWAGKVCILCGSGNNGGDGFALACILKERTDCVLTVYTLSSKFSPDAAHYAARAQKMGIDVRHFDPAEFASAEQDIVVDCLLGTGFRGQVRDNYRAAIEAINESRARVISVDINSGMNGDTGEGETVVNSHLTVTIGMLKTGLLLPKAGKHMKRLVCVDIGILPLPGETMEKHPAPRWLSDSIFWNI